MTRSASTAAMPIIGTAVPVGACHQHAQPGSKAGPLKLECQVLHVAETGQPLIACCAAPSSATEQAFIQLAAHAVRG
jgi:hypothetical protein